jgi:hypothetical protein
MATLETYEQSQKRRNQVKQLEVQASENLLLQKGIINALSEASPNPPTTGQQKLNQLIISRVVSFAGQAFPTLYTSAEELGIQNIVSGNATLPDLCVDPATLEKIYSVRNNIVSQINSISRYLTITQKSLNILTDLLNGQINIVKALTLIRTTTSIGAKAIPTLPGAIGSALSDLESLRLTLTFDLEGNPKLEKTKQIVSQGNQYITQASIVLSKITQVLNSIDLVLRKCQPNPLDTISEETEALVAIAQQPITPTTQVYKGFILTLETKPYSNTVNQTRGVASNSQGIPLLTTPYSFTTKPELLLNNLIFKINSENLKAE